jgi:Zn-dependent protease with chaperone function
MMKRKDYNSLIERLKTFAEVNPAAYQKRVLWLGVLGYSYIFLVLAVLLGATVFCVWHLLFGDGGKGGIFKLLIFLLFFSFLIIKSIWIRMEPPVGFLVTRTDAPDLFGILDDIIRQQNSVVPDAVYLNNDFNAFISQVPRLGIFGWYKNFLVLGLPYMFACNSDQFKAVLAHEFGHFSGAHGRTGTWVYRVRASWYNIQRNMQESQQYGAFIFRWFFNWYIPYFNAYSFVLIRQHEYEADHWGTKYAGARVNAEELVNSTIKGQVTGPYWEKIWARVNDEPDPPPQVFSNAVILLKQPVPELNYQQHLQKSLTIRTQNEDTHPSLKDRLNAIGFRLREGQIMDADGKLLSIQQEFLKSAAEEMLPESVITRALKQFDQEWAESVRKDWQARHEHVKTMKESLKTLNKKYETGALTQEEMTDRAYIIDQISERDAAIKAIGEILDRYPNHAAAHYRLGEILIAQDDEKGVEHLKKAMLVDESFKSAGLEKISWYYERLGKYEKVEHVLEDFDKSLEMDQKDYAERNNITGKDRFKEHGLPFDTVSDIQQKLKPFEKEFKDVYLIQKELKIYPKEPLYVLAVKARVSGFHWSPAEFNQALLKKLIDGLQFNIQRGTVYIIVGDPGINKLASKIPGAVIYNHKKK